MNAKGDVLFLSVGSFSSTGSFLIPNSSVPDERLEVALPFLRICSTISPTWSPRYIEIIAGGASLAPNLWSLPVFDAASLNNTACLSTAAIVQASTNWNNLFSSGFLPGLNKLIPSSVVSDQLLCLPEPLIPSNGFSCNKHTRPCFVAVFFNTSITKRLLSNATFEIEKIGAISCWAGATSLCSVFAVIPNFHNWMLISSIKAFTLGLIAPK